MLISLTINFPNEMPSFSEINFSDVFENLRFESKDKKKEFLKVSFLKMKHMKPMQEEKLSLYANLAVNPLVMMKMIDQRNIKLF